RAWKARWGIEVIHRLMKQHFALGRCRCRTIQAQDNWAWCVVEALHAVRLVRQEQPQLTWRAAQHRAAQHTELYVLTEVQPVPQQLHAA
ncbi:transposase, partial [Deinococcus sp. Arct2-2]|uniref:transposase n=1 Tax=Deinococcus sp. Arct2-2 TaxID=2568653 RepID=UPI001454BF34